MGIGHQKPLSKAEREALMKEKRQSGCIGGEEVEANLKPLIEMMKHMVKGAKGDKKALAKLKEEKSKLSELLPTILKQKDQKAGDYFFEGLGGLFQVAINIALCGGCKKGPKMFNFDLWFLNGFFIEKS